MELASPIHTRQISVDEKGRLICTEDWPSLEMQRMYFVVFTMVVCYLLPLIFISLCYFLIWIKVFWRRIPTDTRDPTMTRL